MGTLIRREIAEDLQKRMKSVFLLVDVKVVGMREISH